MAKYFHSPLRPPAGGNNGDETQIKIVVCVRQNRQCRITAGQQRREFIPTACTDLPEAISDCLPEELTPTNYCRLKFADIAHAVRESGRRALEAAFPVLFWFCIVDLNLETLKSEILDYLERSDFAVFRSHAGALEGLPIITWDTERCPDYRAFLDVARKAGEKLILFASQELAEDEIDEILEELEDTEFTREERRELENRLGKAQRHIGETCTLELAFDHNSHLYVYEAQPDWYEDFLDACEEISSVIPIEDTHQGSGEDGLGGFYSNN